MCIRDSPYVDFVNIMAYDLVDAPQHQSALNKPSNYWDCQRSVDEYLNAGLEFFFPRMGRGGVILLSGCSDTRYRGVAKAVEDLESRYGALLMLPVGDLDGTVMIVHP